MRIPFTLILAAALALPSVSHADDHFPLPPTVPGQPLPGTAGASDDVAPTTCDQGQLMAWFHGWRQRQREKFASVVEQNIPSIAPSNSATCINSPVAHFENYVPNGDYFAVGCLAQKDGVLTHVFVMNLNVTVDQSCLGDQALQQYINQHMCGRVAGATQNFLTVIMKPCAAKLYNLPPMLRPNAPPTATPIDVTPTYFSQTFANLNQRSNGHAADLIDPITRRVKGGTLAPGPGNFVSHEEPGSNQAPADDCASSNNPFCARPAQ